MNANKKLYDLHQLYRRADRDFDDHMGRRAVRYTLIGVPGVWLTFLGLVFLIALGPALDWQMIATFSTMLLAGIVLLAVCATYRRPGTTGEKQRSALQEAREMHAEVLRARMVDYGIDPETVVERTMPVAEVFDFTARRNAWSPTFPSSSSMGKRSS